jgi:two-component system sensor kinase FixL
VQPDADEKIKKHHAMIEQEVHNAAHIVSDLLDYVRVISTDRKTVPVSKLVEHTLGRFPVPASIMVSLKIAVDLPTIYVDPLHVEQVLGNLVTNACQAMSDGGKLIISAREVVPVYARGQKKKMVAIAVKDTGTGITPENKEKLFEALFSTKAKGIGLGLAVSK